MKVQVKVGVKLIGCQSPAGMRTQPLQGQWETYRSQKWNLMQNRLANHHNFRRKLPVKLFHNQPCNQQLTTNKALRDMAWDEVMILQLILILIFLLIFKKKNPGKPLNPCLNPALNKLQNNQCKLKFVSGFKRRTEQMTDSSDKKTPCSTPHRKQFKKDSHPVDYVSIALQRSKIPENFQFLFQLYGVYQVEDLKELGLQAIQDIENSVSTDSFPKVDFTSRSAQIKHLGYQLGQTSSGQTKPYKIEPLIRRRILEELPKVLDSVIKEKAEYENFRNKILKPNTINISSFTYPEQDSQGDSVFAVEESLSTGLSSLPQSEDFSNSCSNPSSLANNNLNQDDESQLAILGPSSSRVGENKKGFSNTLRHKAPEIQLLGGPSRDGSDQDTTSTLNEFGKKVWTHQELSELGANLALKGVVKIKEFWSMTSHGTLHGGEFFN